MAADAGRETTVTTRLLAELKRLEPAFLESLGLSDQPYGVRFTYHTLDGSPARPRRRIALRGADGSCWEPNSTLPIVPYTAPDHLDRISSNGSLIVVEGESDCWTGWFHGLAVLGVPGGGAWSCISLAHVAPADAVYVQRENESSTFQGPVDKYIITLSCHLRQIGFSGEIFELKMPDGLSDLSELHCDDPARFLGRLQCAMNAAARIRE
jgi:putative DNA primase/helicase